MTDVKSILLSQRAFFATGVTRDVEWRRSALRRLELAVERNERALCDALHADLGKSCVESYMTEIGMVLGEIRLARRRLRRWARPRRCPTPLFAQPARSRVVAEPLGVVLVVSPWNYPLNLSIIPLAGAVAAGNCVVLKLSPRSRATDAVVARIVAESFDARHVTCVEHSDGIMDALLAERFDHIFYTGGGAYAREIMRRAAETLTPVTLELGGKSPCIVGSEADIRTASRRIVWGKTLNAGQTCVAPDYLLVHESVKGQLLKAMSDASEEFFGADASLSPDYPRMISPEAAERAAELMATSGGRVVSGGECRPEERYVAFTVIDAPAVDSRLMREEIFAPILPVIAFSDLDEAIEYVAGGEKSLALYYFGSRRNARRVMAATSSGGVAVNDVVMQLGNAALPFGGVGASGIGRYHGRASFDLFSNRRAVYEAWRRFDIPLRYPPYKAWILELLRRIM